MMVKLQTDKRAAAVLTRIDNDERDHFCESVKLITNIGGDLDVYIGKN